MVKAERALFQACSRQRGPAPDKEGLLQTERACSRQRGPAPGREGSAPDREGSAPDREGLLQTERALLQTKDLPSPRGMSIPNVPSSVLGFVCKPAVIS